MARIAYTVPQAAPALAVLELALAPLATRAGAEWSIDQEPMGPGWHDSSWMLRKGLDVFEGVPTEAIPHEWRLRWWLAAEGGV